MSEILKTLFIDIIVKYKEQLSLTSIFSALGIAATGYGWFVSQSIEKELGSVLVKSPSISDYLGFALMPTALLKVVIITFFVFSIFVVINKWKSDVSMTNKILESVLALTFLALPVIILSLDHLTLSKSYTGQIVKAELDTKDTLECLTPAIDISGFTYFWSHKENNFIAVNNSKILKMSIQIPKFKSEEIATGAQPARPSWEESQKRKKLVETECLEQKNKVFERFKTNFHKSV